MRRPRNASLRARWTQRALYFAAFLALGVLLQAMLGCAASVPQQPEYDAYGYPVDYPIPPHDRFGVCAVHRHPDCHAHHMHYIEDGDQKVYLWEHGHHRQQVPRAASRR